MKLLLENFRKFIVEEEEEPKKTIARIEEEEFVEDDGDGVMVRKINMYDDAGEHPRFAPTLSYSPADPRFDSKEESPKPTTGWLKKYLKFLGWELALESALPPSFEDKQ